MQNDHKSLLSPEEESIIDILANHAPETKSDPETERIVTAALDGFWSAAINNTAYHAFACIQIPSDLVVRLEAAAYDAIEAWRAENLHVGR